MSAVLTYALIISVLVDLSEVTPCVCFQKKTGGCLAVTVLRNTEIVVRYMSVMVTLPSSRFRLALIPERKTTFTYLNKILRRI